MTRKKRIIGECVYCGRNEKLSFDHIPPKNLFAIPRPNNLIKVPSCASCHSQNPQVSKDDEYFRQILVLREDVANHPDVIQILPTVYRSFAKPKSRGMVISLLKTMREVEVISRSGLYVGRKTSYNADLPRLDNVAKRIIKGLFWHEKGYRLPDEYDAVAYSQSGLQHLKDDVRQNLVKDILTPLGAVTPKIIGNRVFSYRVIFLPDDSNTSLWLFSFYNRVNFLCFTYSPVRVT